MKYHSENNAHIHATNWRRQNRLNLNLLIAALFFIILTVGSALGQAAGGGACPFFDACGVCRGDGSSCQRQASAQKGQSAPAQTPDCQRRDICGVCNGDGAACLDCKGVPFGRAVVDECGVCEGPGAGLCGCGDDYSCLECRYLLSGPSPDVIISQENSAGREEVLSNFHSGASCLSQILSRCLDPGKPRGRSLEECLAAALPRPADDHAAYTHGFFMGQDCKVMPKVNERSLCGPPGIEWLATPISLVWHAEDQPRAAALVQFPLNPHLAGKWYVWRGSGATPLLIHDPQRSGTVKRAEQLFGSWTFGPKAGRAPGKPLWQNGYQALAQLDHNYDGKLSASELEALSLWFDDNQDGISQAGEVRSLDQAGITAIYTLPDKQAKGAELSAAKGFDRVQDGRLVSGASFDWTSMPYDSRDQAAAALQQQAALGSAGSSAPAVSRLTAAAPLPAAVATLKPAADGPLSGVWAWSAELAAGPRSHWGFLILREAGGDLSGTSLVEVLFKTNQEGVRSYITAFPLNGRSVRLGTGVQLTFTARHEGRVIAESSAEWASSPDELSGTSRVQAGAAPLDYAWRAFRVKKQ